MRFTPVFVSWNYSEHKLSLSLDGLLVHRKVTSSLSPIVWLNGYVIETLGITVYPRKQHDRELQAPIHRTSVFQWGLKQAGSW